LTARDSPKKGLADDKMIENLVNDILVKHDGHLTMGLIGMQCLMP
jgi:hypothetical protein